MPHLPPLAHHTLCLLLEFDLQPVDGRAELPYRDHAAAARQACEDTNLFLSVHLAARSRVVEKADVQSLQQLPFDSFLLADEKEVPLKLDFCYELGEAPKLGIRVFTDLRALDGVTATRLALHVLEVVEAGDAVQVKAGGFTRNKTFVQSPQQIWNTLRVLFWLILDLSCLPLRFLCKLLTCYRLEPNSPEGWLWYYRHSNHQPADIAMFSPEGDQFKSFLSQVDAWRKGLGLRHGFFFLLNYSPAVSVGVADDVSKLTASRTEKLKHAFGPPQHPKVGANLHAVYLLLHRRMMFNNYGKHQHKFTAIPTKFCWDWLNFPATLTCAFCITVNGKFLAGIRGVGPFIERGEELLKPELGESVKMQQIIHHPNQGWSGAKSEKIEATVEKDICLEV